MPAWRNNRSGIGLENVAVLRWRRVAVGTQHAWLFFNRDLASSEPRELQLVRARAMVRMAFHRLKQLDFVRFDGEAVGRTLCIATQTSASCCR